MISKFSSHVAELKSRLKLAFSVFIAVFIVCYFYATNLYSLLARPFVAASGDKASFIYTHLTEAFVTEIKVALYAALFISLPVFIVQIYRFIAVGLFRKEKRIALLYIISSIILFYLGVALVYYYIMPLAWAFFLGYQQSYSEELNLVLNAKISEYLDLSLQFMLAFGLAFQLPIILVLLCQLKLIQPAALVKYRKHAIVFIFLLAAILTPPDIISQIALAIPLMILYELSIFLAKRVS